MLCPPLAEQVRYYKEPEGGVENMNNELREFWEEKTRKAVEKADHKKSIETARYLLSIGKLSYKEISEASKLSVDEVKKLASQRTA